MTHQDRDVDGKVVKAGEPRKVWELLAHTLIPVEERLNFFDDALSLLKVCIPAHQSRPL